MTHWEIQILGEYSELFLYTNPYIQNSKAAYDVKCLQALIHRAQDQFSALYALRHMALYVINWPIHVVKSRKYI